MTTSPLTPELEAIVARATEIAPQYARVSPEARARALVAAADALESAKEQLLPIAMRETGLTEARLTGEITRSAVQMRMFAEVVTKGDYLDARIDEPDSEFALGIRPDLRRTHIPLGPIINFAASNFPFAFSVPGGDSASILAAGCPLIVKAHSGHPELSDATAAVLSKALTDAGMPEGLLQIIHGTEAGVAVLSDPRIKGGSFTGSIAAGRLLADIAASRPTPIPFYGELGSVNPVFITREAIAERAADIVSGYLTSVAGSAGQLCTKPGVVFVPESHGLDETIANAAGAASEHRLLNPRIAEGYASGRAAILAIEGVRIVHEGSLRFDAEGHGWATPTIVAAPLETVRRYADPLTHEVFGPMSVLVEVPDGVPYAPLMAELFEGNLTGTVHLSAEEKLGGTENASELRDLVDAIALQAGRVLFDGWPTGVAVTPAQTHGGPWPATTNDSSTSVGTAAIQRFQRPVTYQNVGNAFLPAELQDENPRGITRAVAPAGESRSWGERWR